MTTITILRKYWICISVWVSACLHHHTFNSTVQGINHLNPSVILDHSSLLPPGSSSSHCCPCRFRTPADLSGGSVPLFLSCFCRSVNSKPLLLTTEVQPALLIRSILKFFIDGYVVFPQPHPDWTSVLWSDYKCQNTKEVFTLGKSWTEKLRHLGRYSSLPTQPGLEGFALKSWQDTCSLVRPDRTQISRPLYGQSWLDTPLRLRHDSCTGRSQWGWCEWACEAERNCAAS